MSERRKVQGAMIDASLALDTASQHLGGAITYLETYDFLQESNPDLLKQLKEGQKALLKLSAMWWNLQVKS